jgi:thioredoxin-related protein
VLLSGQGLGRAAVDTSAAKAGMELVVFEHPDCTTCPIFRSVVAPRYQNSPQGAEAPLRFVDIVRADTSRYDLNAPITMVPTAVLIKNGREVDRIAGYWGPDNFFKMMAYIIAKAE